MIGAYEYILILVWKNFKIQVQHFIKTFFEIVLPIFFIYLIASMRNGLKETDIETSTTYFPVPFLNEGNIWVIAYSPPMPRFEQVFSKVAFGAILIRCRNAKELENRMRFNSSILAGIEFDNNVDFSSMNKIIFSLRFPDLLSADAKEKSTWATDNLYPNNDFPMYKPRENKDDLELYQFPDYSQEGFLKLQYFVSVAIIDILTAGNTILPNLIELQRYAFPPYTEDQFLDTIGDMICLFNVFGYAVFVQGAIANISNEKERGLKEAMKAMGLKNWLNWTAWFITFLLLMIIPVIIISVLLTKILRHSSGTVIFSLELLYLVTTITFCFMVTTVCKKATNATILGVILWIFTYSPMFFAKPTAELDIHNRILLCFGHSYALGNGLAVIADFERSKEGAQWNNLWKKARGGPDNIVLGQMFVMLTVDCLIFLLIALYLDEVNPGQYGVAKPWNFLFNFKPESNAVEDEPPQTSTHTVAQDPEPTNLKKGIEIRNLRKVFGKDNAAVKGLSMNMYEDQITVLLGHNGAGKTTTINMLTGLCKPTSGTAILNGFDLITDLKQVRSSFGFCPQHNILFDDLTVNEHIYLFSRLKGLSSKSAKEESIYYCQKFGLKTKMNRLSSKLSGGMKRKLCMCIALCADSKIILLDEPSSGLDPLARREVWDILQVEKKGRTVLLTTHYMDEADVLGDRIAIMSDGLLQCCGSSFFLKKKYAAKYHLTIDKAAKCDPKQVTKLLSSHISNLEIHTNVGSELTYVLPEDKINRFEGMLEILERSSKDLGINSYGISVATLEDVFLKVGSTPLSKEPTPNKPLTSLNS